MNAGAAVALDAAAEAAEAADGRGVRPLSKSTVVVGAEAEAEVEEEEAGEG